MNLLTPFFSADRLYNELLPWLRQRLSLAGLRVMQTFDLNTARMNLEDCPCPHHGTDQCDCQMIVLLVYGNAAEPETLIMHGNEGHTWLSLVNTPGQHADSALQKTIENALRTTNPLEARSDLL